MYAAKIIDTKYYTKIINCLIYIIYYNLYKKLYLK